MTIITINQRVHLSGAANGGRSTSGWFEGRDIVGSLRYLCARDDTQAMTIGLFSRCLGCNSTFAAMTQFPDEFGHVRCLVGAQPVTTDVIVRHQLGLAGVPEHRLDAVMTSLDDRIRVTTSFGFAARDHREWAKNVRIPTLLSQVHDDVLSDPSDVQTMFDNLPVTDKKLHWIQGTIARWDGYVEFQRRPQPMLDWLADHMA